MRIGLLARADDRGIGIQTWEWYRHVEPERTLVVRLPAAERVGFPAHLDRYRGADVETFDGAFDETRVRRWLNGLDVVYMVETPYDWRFFDWAREEGVRTVVHANPEFFRWATDPSAELPDVWWVPTTWRLDVLPDSVRVVPVPVPLDRFTPRVRDRAERFLHVGGHPAMLDRNGTGIVAAALRWVRQPCTIVMATQSQNPVTARARQSRVHVEHIVGGVDDYWSLYDNADVLVLPRRYGGLCLPALEAMGAGLGLVMSDVSPQDTTWPGWHLPARQQGSARTPAGEIATYNVQPRVLAQRIDELVLEPHRAADLSAASICWAQEHSWAALLPTILAELDRACS